MTAALHEAGATAALRPDRRFLLAHPAHWIALGLGSGLPRAAPGTFGTLTGWLLFVVLDRWLGDLGWAVLIAAAWPIGAWAAQRTGRALGQPDSGHIVIDEIVAFWIVLWLLPAGQGQPLALQAVAFLLFRLFDIAKPPPIRRLDRRLKNGFGVMLDDLVAAFYALLAIALLIRLTGGPA